MAGKKRIPPNFQGMDPNEGARALLRYLAESIDDIVEVRALLEVLVKHIQPMYTMIYEIHQRLGGQGAVSPLRPNPVAAEVMGRVVEVAKKAATGYAKKLLERMKAAGL